jgi:hypothetical protein
VVIDLESTRVVIASIEDLVRLKRAANRPKDIEDVAALEAIARMDDVDE